MDISDWLEQAADEFVRTGAMPLIWQPEVPAGINGFYVELRPHPSENRNMWETALQYWFAVTVAGGGRVFTVRSITPEARAHAIKHGNPWADA